MFISWKSVEAIGGNKYKFNYPSGICFNSIDQRIYIADLHNHRVCSLKIGTWEMEELSREILWGKSDLLIQKPLGISHDNRGEVIISDVEHQMLFKYNPISSKWIPIINDGLQRLTPTLNLPSGVTVDSLGNIYTNDFLNNRIIKITEASAEVLIGGLPHGMKDGAIDEAKINKPYGIFSKGNSLYFADTGNNMIRQIDFASNKVTTIISKATEESFLHPVTLTLDSMENIYVCEQRRILFYHRTTGKLYPLVDKSIWMYIKDKFKIKERICYTGAIAVPQEGKLYWVDTIKGIIYIMTYSLGM